MDVWVLTTEEKLLFEKQFYSLNPTNGNITGENAKRFLMQSRLPANILGFIWELSDVNCDGRLNINEFLVACKLIKTKLLGINVPPVLPPSLLSIINSSAISSPVNSLASPLSIQTPPLVSGATAIRPDLSSISPVIIPTSNLLETNSVVCQPPIPITTQISQQSVLPATLVKTSTPIIAHGTMGRTRTLSLSSNSDDLFSLDPISSGAGSQAQHNFTPTIPLVGTADVSQQQFATNTSNNVTKVSPESAMLPSLIPGTAHSELQTIDSPSSTEWAIPYQIKLKYTQIFNATDKNRTGFMTGVQARHIMVESQLSHPVLAQIWTLADIDSDGQLSCEEFVLAMYLCETAKSGQKITVPLPFELIPPTFRRQQHSSITSPSAINVSGETSPIGQTTFEDKRKENFEKGQAELERRRKALLEIQQKEKEEQERKERGEFERKERIRLEQEKIRQEELERQLLKQRELEQEKEDQRRKLQEQRDIARREIERQQHIEWENQRRSELQKKHQEEQESVSKLSVENNTLSSLLQEQIKNVSDLSLKISETRISVTGVKSTIDGMRNTRDTQMNEIVQLKGKLKEQNQRVIVVNQEKARLDAKHKTSHQEAGEITQDKNIQINKKQIALVELKEKLTALELQAETSKSKYEDNCTQLTDLKDTLKSLVSECEKLYAAYVEKRNVVLEMKAKAITETSWAQSAWDTAPSVWQAANNVDDTPAITVTSYKKYRAFYEFIARNEDELSFQPGDIIMVSTNQHAEPGWLAGELKGQAGWFPESYVECIEDIDSSVSYQTSSTDEPVVNNRTLEEIIEVPEIVSDGGSTTTEDTEWGPSVDDEDFTPSYESFDINYDVQAVYSRKARNTNQLTFNKGDIIHVTKQQGSWYYGELAALYGWIPVSYVTQLSSISVEPSNDSNLPADEQEYYIAVYPYQSTEPGDLSFMPNSIIKVIKKDGEWWTGILNDNVGVFPSNYVHKMDSQPTATSPTFSESKVPRCSSAPPTELDFHKMHVGRSMTPDFSVLSSNQGGRVKKPEIASVIAPYKATGSEQLSLQKGQLIIIRKKTTAGWWEGEVYTKGKRRQIGWFPASYVKCLSFGGNNSTDPSNINTNFQGNQFKPKSSSYDKVIALYKYTALNPDELSFEKDDIITMIAKEEPDWWKGELNGSVGLFPSNYVVPM